MKFIKTILGILILLIILISIIFFYQIYAKNSINREIINTIENIEIIDKDININDLTENNILKQENIIGILEIPSINLKVPICNSTDEESLKKYIGHFEHTSIYKGNIGLASHAFGFQYNYFSDIDKLNRDDIIIYKSIYGTKQYKVDIKLEILENDWSYLNNTENDTLTLITCIKNKPTYRLCIKASVR